MARAYVLIVTAAGTSETVRSAIEAIEGVTEAHVVAGDFDVVAELEAPDVSSMLPVLTEGIHGLDGVGHTRTYVVLG